VRAEVADRVTLDNGRWRKPPVVRRWTPGLCILNPVLAFGVDAAMLVRPTEGGGITLLRVEISSPAMDLTPWNAAFGAQWVLEPTP
jgi:hypothetical protein